MIISICFKSITYTSKIHYYCQKMLAFDSSYFIIKAISKPGSFFELTGEEGQGLLVAIKNDVEETRR